MPHIPIILDAIEALESKSAAPPTEAEQNLYDALHAADDWAHDNQSQTEAIAEITNEAQFVYDYCTYVPVPQQNRLQESVDTLNGFID